MSSPTSAYVVCPLVRRELVENVLEVERFCDEMMINKLILDKTIYHAFLVHALQVGPHTAENHDVYEKLKDYLAHIKDDESVIVDGDLNYHVDVSNTGSEEVIRISGFGVHNDDGLAPSVIYKNHHLEVVNTFFRKDSVDLIY